MSFTPQQYRMPAEWEPHGATWIAWPHQHDDWPGKFEPIPWVYVEIVRHLHHSEHVCILVNDAATEKLARDQLSRQTIDFARLTFVHVATDRSWTRDYCPIFVRDTGVGVALDWQFNGWAKYDNWHNDDAVSQKLAGRLGWRVQQPTFRDRRIVLEGGAVDVNGQGLLLATEECLLSATQCRNPGFTKRDYEQIFADYLGIDRVIWLGRGIIGDDTHGHVDDLARFVGPRTIVTVVEENKDDPNYAPLRDNLRRLRKIPDVDVITMPMPEPLFFDGQRLPASYANFYVANKVVLAPTFNDPHDRIALNVLAEVFPDRRVVGIHSVDLVWGLGTLHCLTQQQPLAS